MIYSLQFLAFNWSQLWPRYGLEMLFLQESKVRPAAISHASVPQNDLQILTLFNIY